MLPNEKQEVPQCEHPSVAYVDHKIVCGACGRELPKVVKAEDITRVVAGYTRSVNWDRQIWTYPITLEARVSCTSWREIRQAYLELFEEARKDTNNAVRITRDEFADATKRPEYLG